MIVRHCLKLLIMASLTNISVAQSVKNWKLIDYHKLTPTGAGKQCILADIRSYLVCPFLNGKRTWPTGSSYYRYIVHVYISFSVIYSARVDSEIFFQLAKVTVSLRGQSMKWFVPRCSTTVRMSFFSMRVINCWNALPKHVIEAPSFKNSEWVSRV